MSLRVPTPVVACLASLLVLGGCRQSADTKATTHIPGAVNVVSLDGTDAQA